MLVDVNAGAWCALLLTLSVYAPGWAWAGALCPRGDNTQPIHRRLLLFGAVALLAGLAIQLATILILAECAAFSVRLHVALTAAWCAAGLAATFVRRPAWARLLLDGLPGAAATILTTWLIMFPNGRGEWLAGGWDPGIYVNQGVSISRTEQARFDPDPLFSLLADDEFAAFTRSSFNFTEALPVVPLDVASRRPLHFFFKLTPSLVALLDRCGGLRAATRVNTFVGVWVLFALAAAVGTAFGRAAPGWFAAAALLIHPIFVYHLHIPTSEMVQVLLSAGLLLALTLPTPRSRAGATALLLLLAQINRFSFFPFGGLWLALLTWFDAGRADRNRVLAERAIQVAFLLAGVAYDAQVNAVTLGRLGVVVRAILVAGGALCAAALAAEALLRRPAPRAAALALADRTAMPAALLGASALFLAAWFRVPWLPGEFRPNVQSALPYIRWALLPGALGAAILVCPRTPRAVRLWAIFLLAGSLAALSSAQIMKLTPWSTRRQLEFAVPLMALCAGLFADAVWQRSPHAWRVPLAALMAALLAWGQGGQLRRAWTVTEYNGLSRRLSEIAERLAPGDIVVADHFVWGTPLRFIHGIPVVNGELYIEPVAQDKFERALTVLRRLHGEGRVIRFLTSTERGLGVYPVEMQRMELDWESAPYDYAIVAHGPATRDFRPRPRHKEFRLYTWTPLPNGG